MRNSYKNIICFLVCVVNLQLWICNSSIASTMQDISYKSEVVSNLSQVSVNTIFQDHIGYVWIGTQNGLNRYDGYEVKEYYHDKNDTLSLCDQRIPAIYEDRNKNLWISTDRGLNRYNRDEDNFTRYLFGRGEKRTSSIYEDERFLWYSVKDKQFQLYEKETDSFKSKKINTDLLDENSVIYDIVRYDENNLLLSVSNAGLFLYDLRSENLELFYAIPRLHSVGLYMKNGKIWCASYNREIYIIDREGNLIKSYKSEYGSLLRSNILDFKYNPLDNNFWVATDGSGAYVFDQDLNLMNHFRSGPGYNELLPDNSITSIHFDHTGNIWLGSVRSGAIMLSKSKFEYFQYLKGNRFGLGNKSVNSFCEDSDNNIWIGTDGGGLHYFDQENQVFVQYKNKQFEKITAIVDYNKDLLLASSYTHGLWFINKKNGNISSAGKHPLFKNLKLSYLVKLFSDSQNNIWVGGRVLYKINPLKNTIEQFSLETHPETIKTYSTSFLSAFEDENRVIWFSTPKGFFSFDLNTNEPGNSYQLGRVVSLKAYDEDLLILSTGQVKYFNKKTGLISDASISNDPKYKNIIFYTFFVDKKKQIWCGTNKGLLKIVKEGKTEKIYEYQITPGLVKAEFSFGPLFSSKGKLYFGSNNGFIRFNPDRMDEEESLSHSIITKIAYFSSRGKHKKDGIIGRNISDSYEIELPYQPASYDFHFNNFLYHEGTNLKYSYTLENFETRWNTTTTPKASYLNLPPGDYVFKVKASLQNYLESEPTIVYVTILPPWWQTTWFKSLVALFTLVVIFAIWSISISRVKLKQQLTMENEVNQMKLRFFTNISHELKTPLTLIYGPLKKIMSGEINMNEIKFQLPFLYRNSQRLKMLVEQLMEFRKAEMSELVVKREWSDLVSDCKEVMSYFSHQARNEEIRLTIDSTIDKMEFWYDKDKLTKTMFNLISNALKYTGSGNSISIMIEPVGDEYIQIAVKDTGAGIRPEEIDKIFERYYQAEYNVEGTGIGLALVKRLVEVQDGTITVESEFGEGSTFFVCLPYLKDNKPVREQKIEVAKLVKPEIEFDEEKEPFKAAESSVYSVLIVEDDWNLRNYLEQILGNNFKVITAKDGEQGLEKAIHDAPDIIVSDIMMPVMDGLTFCKKIKEDLRVSHIPVVLLTAKTTLENQMDGYKSGADAYITKPFDEKILISQIESLLYNRALLKERFSHDFGIKVQDVTHTETDEKFLQKAIGIVEMNIENPKFDVSVFVEQLGLSRTIAYRKIKAISGKSVKEFVITIRLQKAAVLLVQTDQTISEIAISCGFADHSYFSAVFKKNFDLSPTEYRIKEREKESGK